MAGKTISDWGKSMKETGLNVLKQTADRFHTIKQEDVERLKKSGLPQYDWFVLPYRDFSQKNNNLTSWMNKYTQKGEGFCIRAIPTEEGIKKGLTRKPKFGYLSFQYCINFLNEKTRDTGKEDWNIIMSNWEEDNYGGVIISGDRFVIGEISSNLEKLTSMEQTPLAGFIFDRGGLGYITDKTKWMDNSQEKAKSVLWKTFFNNIKQGDDNFNPSLLKGYFEFVYTKTDKIRFLDFKENEQYIKI
ncbi:MAG: hypothetical protein WCX73_03965 [Candidatus Pacearchaeota archaeon]|jgi:hypothetical protein